MEAASLLLKFIRPIERYDYPLPAISFILALNPKDLT